MMVYVMYYASLTLGVQEREHRKQLHNRLVELQGNIRVICRARPVLDVNTYYNYLKCILMTVLLLYGYYCTACRSSVAGVAGARWT